MADSGSTKTDWLVVDPKRDRQHSFHTIGLNPFFVNDVMVAQTLQEIVPGDLAQQVTHVYFYGAGCSSETRNAVIFKGLDVVFPSAVIEVYHDLLGAARACCGHEAGIASILGTGSNSCKYDGTQIVDNVTNLGFILGDEGSGGHIGKELIRARSYREMPKALEEDFDATFGYAHEEMLGSVYNMPMPNRYVASFAPFCAKHKSTTFIQQLLRHVFNSFVTKHLLKYDAPGWSFHFLGSIAQIYEAELTAVMKDHGLNMGCIIRKPIASLTQFHLEEHAL